MTFKSTIWSSGSGRVKLKLGLEFPPAKCIHTCIQDLYFVLISVHCSTFFFCEHNILLLLIYLNSNMVIQGISSFPCGVAVWCLHGHVCLHDLELCMQFPCFGHSEYSGSDVTPVWKKCPVWSLIFIQYINAIGSVATTTTNNVHLSCAHQCPEHSHDTY